MKSMVLNCLRGISVGDAFGFKLSTRPAFVRDRRVPEGPWYWSDDTALACALVTVLLEVGEVDQDILFTQFYRCFHYDPRRGYGSGMKKLFRKHTDGGDWQESVAGLFRGTGSYGNGAAMRVPPLGVYFSSDLDHVVAQARLSALVTHAHPEGVAGAIAVAVASAQMSRGMLEPEVLLEEVISRTPVSEVRRRLEASRALGVDDFTEAVDVLGNGAKISAQDTVPLCVWWVAQMQGRFEDAMWGLVEAGGDEDTTCAIVGGILSAGGTMPPDSWQTDTEALPALEMFPPASGL